MRDIYFFYFQRERDSETMSPVVAPPVDLAPAGGMDLVPVQQQHQPGGGQVSLSVLIEMMVQKIYHELTILAELLPSKTYIER